MAQEKPRLRGRNQVAAAQAGHTSTQEILEDLDVFFDYDDAGINDRDVLKGLQVAVHAAADGFYDACLWHKTGLRIRRFLTDPKLTDGAPTRE
ncbi:hypothetical protein DL769_006661 [Monosporascus sp. CRB-8-3]|nr:hypothetical protein DL769_006661 [Monosporascus sp. CRB-8-3]